MDNENSIEIIETPADSNNKSLSVWNGILTAALKLPGAKIDRSAYLKKELKKYYTEEEVNYVISNGYKDSVVKKQVIDKIAKSVIKAHSLTATSISFATGLPGGWWMAGTIPADLTQFYYQVLVVAQKLAYLYGWPSFDDELPTDEYLGLLTLFIGIMSGVSGATAAVTKVAETFACQVAKHLPKMALTKMGFYGIAKQIGKLLGINITKQTVSKGLSKAIPILGGILSGTITAATFIPMANKLREYLAGLPITQELK